MIDEKLVPARVAFDASILISALDITKTDARDLMARELFEFAVQHRTLCIASPALAESLLSGHTPPFGLARVEFVDFDVRSARAMHQILGDRAGNAPAGSSRKIAKFDAMIIAAYHVRGRVGAFISGDKSQLRMAKSIGLHTLALHEVCLPEPPSAESQLGLPLGSK